MSKVSNKIHLQKNYEQAYKSLNPSQKKAVDLIEGPVLVVAGPGTGKTQILALRIGHILRTTDTRPNHILCLTYTDAGAIAMRKRLLHFIGPEAYRVQVHTFHSFCNHIIQENQELFSDYETLHHITDLEKTQLFKKLIDRFPYEHPLRRLKGQLYYEAKRMNDLFSLMKRESWTPDHLLNHIEGEYKIIEEDPDNFYKVTRRNFKAGDPKKKFYDKKNNLQILEAAAKAFDPFQEMMREAGRYDFDDMIHWVLTAFQSDEALLASYQERFLYVLVDEYQDTNGSQNQIIELLVDYWENPNLFVVGDDDQAIFRFQGANISNLHQLYEKYTPQVVVLTENYRSTEPILDGAMNLIENNSSRITDQIPGVEKKLTPKTKSKVSIPPQILEYLNTSQEETGIFEAIKDLKTRGIPLQEIAVIYRKHQQATNLIKALSQEGIPIDVKQRTNVLDEPLIKNLENILLYLHKEFTTPGTADTLLFELLHYKFFDLAPLDVAKVSMYCWEDYRSPKSLRKTIKDYELLATFHLENIDTFVRFNETLESWLSQIPHVTLQVLLERILKKGMVFREIMSDDRRTYFMQVLATFFNYLKEESDRHPELTLADFLATLSDMREMDLRLEMQNIMRSKNGVNFMTAHSAKGLEFGHVFILGCNKKHWDRLFGRRDRYKLPSTIIDPTRETDLEDERRLFYVAMTRAKEFLALSYSAENMNSMPDEPSQFLAELAASPEIKPVEKKIETSEAVAYYRNLLEPLEQKLPLIDHALIDKVLERFQLTPTALNKYLTCPRTFYFENILCVPLAHSPYLGFGNAVHNALQKLIDQYNKGLPMTDDRLIRLFKDWMSQYQAHFTPKQYENYLKHGSHILPLYLARMSPQWLEATVLTAEKSISNVTHRDVPVKGRIDLIAKDARGHSKVIDFKTGNVDNTARRRQKLQVPETFDALGGDYWRQMVFYRILIDAANDPSTAMDVGEMSFVEPDKLGNFYSEEFFIDLGQYQIVSEQIVDVWMRLQAHDFDQDCNRKDCHWCNFVKNEFVLPEDTLDEWAEPEEEENTVAVLGQMEFDFH